MSRLRKVSARRIGRWLCGDLDPADLLRLGEDARLDLLREAALRVESGAVAEAERIYRLAEVLWPKDPDVRLGLGACRQTSGDLETAIIRFGGVLADRPDDLYALANRAECLLILGRDQEALSDLQTASRVEGRKGDPAIRDRIVRLSAIADERVSARSAPAPGSS